MAAGTGRPRCGSAARSCARPRPRPSASPARAERTAGRSAGGQPAARARRRARHSSTVIANRRWSSHTPLISRKRSATPSQRSAELLHHASAVGVARHDADLEPMQLHLLEGEAHQHDHGLGDVRPTGPLAIDPVPDGGALQRAAVTLLRLTSPARLVVDEHPERVGVVGRALPVAPRSGRRTRCGRAPGRSWPAGRSGSHGSNQSSLRMAHVAPRREVLGPSGRSITRGPPAAGWADAGSARDGASRPSGSPPPPPGRRERDLIEMEAAHHRQHHAAGGDDRVDIPDGSPGLCASAADSVATSRKTPRPRLRLRATIGRRLGGAELEPGQRRDRGTAERRRRRRGRVADLGVLALDVVEVIVDGAERAGEVPPDAAGRRRAASVAVRLSHPTGCGCGGRSAA